MNHPEPLFRFKQPVLDSQDQQGIIWIHLGYQNQWGLSTYYTRLDQSLLVWAGAVAMIFLTAQFGSLSWPIQAIAWSVLTLAAVSISSRLVWQWVTFKRLRWLIYFWLGLMILGLGLTNYGIFAPHSLILVHLCPIWLGLSAVGYTITGFGMRSQALTLAGLLHLCLIPVLSWFPSHQFLLTGIAMSAILWLLAELQWDHQ